MLKVIGYAIALTVALVFVLYGFGTCFAIVGEETGWFGRDALFLEVPTGALMGFAIAFLIWMSAVSWMVVQRR